MTGRTKSGAIQADIEKKRKSPESAADGIVPPAMTQEQIDKGIGWLPDDERAVIMMRYGLLDGRPRTLEEIERETGTPRERVRQIESMIVGTKCSAWRRSSFKDYLED